MLLQLSGTPGLTCRAMFGGHGLWSSGAFFGILYADRLYFRTGPETVGDYVGAGMEPFRTADFVSINYYEVPPDVLGSGTKLKKWAEAAVESARAAKKKPPRRKRNRT